LWILPLCLDRELRWVVAIEAIDFCVFWLFPSKVDWQNRGKFNLPWNLENVGGQVCKEVSLFLGCGSSPCFWTESWGGLSRLRPLISVSSDFYLQKLSDWIVVNLTCLGTLKIRVYNFAEKSVYFEVVDPPLVFGPRAEVGCRDWSHWFLCFLTFPFKSWLTTSRLPCFWTENWGGLALDFCSSDFSLQKLVDTESRPWNLVNAVLWLFSSKS